MLAELILSVDKNQTLLGSHTGAYLEKSARIALHHLVILGADNSAGYDLLSRDILVMAGLGLGRRSDDRLGETLVLAHTLGKTHSADLPDTRRILAPGAARQITAYDHLDAETLATHSRSHHRIRDRTLPVRNSIRRRVKKLGGYRIENLTLVGNTLGENDVECRDAVSGYHYKTVAVESIDIANFTVIDSLLARKIVICGN